MLNDSCIYNWFVPSSLPAQGRCVGKHFSLASALLPCHLLKSSSVGKEMENKLRQQKRWQVRWGGTTCRKNVERKYTHVPGQRKQCMADESLIKEKKGGGGGTRLQTAEFQCTTWDRLFSPNWFCHVAVGEQLAKDAVVVSKENPQHVCSQHEHDQTGALVGLTEHTMWAPSVFRLQRLPSVAITCTSEVSKSVYF